MMNEEIALFIDFENIRYSLLNVRHHEPDPQELIGVARQFGTVMVARAYADWTRQPDFFKGSLTAAMIDRVDCPAKTRDRFRSNGQGGNFAPFNSFNQPAPAREYAPEVGEDEEPLDEAPADEMEGATAEAEALEGDEIADQQAGDEGFDEEYEDEGEEGEPEDQPQRFEPSNHRPYNQGGYQQGGGQFVTTQSTVDLNMLMDIIETVFDRPSINTYVLMTGDRDFTRICARLKLRLNKKVIVVGVPGTVSRDLISAAVRFIPLGGGPIQGFNRPGPARNDYLPQGPVEMDEPGFIQFLDYIDTHWAWRTIGGVANFIGDPFNPKNRFRGRLTRESARELLRDCVDQGVLLATLDPAGGESLRLNRSHPIVEAGLNERAPQ
ncbi:MAG TPA: NYN domain-containing protein [Ktedonobacterales bacterium]